MYRMTLEMQQARKIQLQKLEPQHGNWHSL
jgi:hypothetical protein